MKIIKECQETSIGYKSGASFSATTCFLRAPQGSMSLDTLTALFNEAKKDFPGLQEKDVTVTRSKPLTGMSKQLAANAGPVVFDTIQFAAPAKPPVSYRRLAPSGGMQG